MTETPIEILLHRAYVAESRDYGAKIAAYPEGRPVVQRIPWQSRIKRALHTTDCASRRVDDKGNRLPCDCGALHRDPVSGNQTRSVRFVDVRSTLDDIGDAAMTMRRVRALRSPWDTVVDAAYTVPYGPYDSRKRAASGTLAMMMHHDTGLDELLMDDTCLHWAYRHRSVMSMSYPVHAKRLGISRQHVLRRCTSTLADTTPRSIHARLTDLLAEACDAIRADSFRDESMVRPTV